MSRKLGGVSRAGGRGKMGRGGLGNRGPVTKCKNFHKQKPQPRAREEAEKQHKQTSQAPRKKTENLWGLDGLVNVY